VRVSVEVTAWYADPVKAKSGYQLLTSNGRLEADLLDQLSDQLAANAAACSEPESESPVTAAAKSAEVSRRTRASDLRTRPQTSGGQRQLFIVVGPGLCRRRNKPLESRSEKTAGQGRRSAANRSGQPGGDSQESGSSQEPCGGEEVRHSGGASASLTAKTLFLASAHDEFEMLDFNRDWVHVRISGLSRGWIWRNSLEMPDSVPDSDAAPECGGVPTAAELFHISREEVALFPGDWSPLRGRNVKIVSVEKNDENGKDSVRSSGWNSLSPCSTETMRNSRRKPQELAGIVVIFDSADGGMIAATFPTLQQWKAGKLSDAALWHQCFFDPPETFTQSGASASQ
jgi:hypothetical protein